MVSKKKVALSNSSTLKPCVFLGLLIFFSTTPLYTSKCCPSTCT